MHAPIPLLLPALCASAPCPGPCATTCPDTVPTCCPAASKSQCCPADFPSCCPPGSKYGCCPQGMKCTSDGCSPTSGVATQEQRAGGGVNGTSARNEPCVKCKTFDGEVATSMSDLFINLPGIILSGGGMGVQGHRTSLQQCVFADGGSGAFGWNWTRGATDPNCSALGACPWANICPGFEQFSIASAFLGIDPFSGISSGAHDLPIDTRTLESFVMELNASYTWSEDSKAPPVFPENGRLEHSRSRFIMDFFISTTEPAPGSPAGHSVTDEIVVDMSYNSGFEFPCQTTSTPIVPANASAVFDGTYHYELVDSGGDVPRPGYNCRLNHFRRVGGDQHGAAVPSKIDLLPFIRYVAEHRAKCTQCTSGAVAGTWIPWVLIATEIFDKTHGEVNFRSMPVWRPKSRA